MVMLSTCHTRVLSLSLSPHTHTHTNTHTHTMYVCRPDDDEDTVSTGCAKISQFFAPKSQDTSKKKHRFFEERGLQNVTDF